MANEGEVERDANGIPLKPEVPAILQAVLKDEPVLEEVKAALKADPSCASTADDRGRTVLSHAAAGCDVQIVSALLDVNAADDSPSGWNAAQYAAFGGRTEVLTAILKAKPALANPSCDDSMTPLMLAALKGHTDCMSLILDMAPKAVDVVTNSGRTPLMLAATGGSVAAVELLVARGADVNATSSEGKTALVWAVTSHKPATVGALAKLGADPDIRVPIPKSAPIIPGQDREKGESAEDFANGKNNKDPCLRHISKYLKEWRESRASDPNAAVPDMPPLPWVQYAIDQKAKAEAEEANKPKPEDEDAIASGEATAKVEEDENDIFGDDVAEPEAPRTESAPAGKKVSIVDVTGSETPAETAAGMDDLDALD